MELETAPAFTRDIRRLRDAALRRRVDAVITQLDAASSLAEIAGVRRVVVPASGLCYRIRIGQYRLGIAIVGDTVVLVRFLHRSEIYRYFP